MVKVLSRNDAKVLAKLEKQIAKNPALAFRTLLKNYSLRQFIDKWLMVFNPAAQRFEKWFCWESQVDLCDKIEAAKVAGKPYFFLLKARQVGGSQIVAAYIVKKLLEGGRFSCIVISQTEDDAKYFIQEIVAPIFDNLPAVKGLSWPKHRVTGQMIEMEDGSYVKAIPSGPDAGRGKRVNLVVMDEAAGGNFVYHADRNFMSIKPTVERSKGQMIVISTAKAGTWFNQQVHDLILGKGRIKNKADWAFIGWKGVPDRNKDWYEDELAQASSEYAHKQEYPETWEDCFVVREGLVFPDFDPSAESRHVKAFAPDWTHRVYLGYDDGWNHPAVFLVTMYDRFQDHLYVLDEIFWTETDRSDIGLDMRRKMAQWKEEASLGNISMKVFKSVADSTINKEGRNVWEILKDTSGISFQSADKYDKGGSLALLQTRFRQNRITINPRCKKTIIQLSGLVWKTHKDERGILRSADEPVKIEDDSVDVLRYICREIAPRKSSAIVPQREFRPYSGEREKFLGKDKSGRPDYAMYGGKNPWVSW